MKSACLTCEGRVSDIFIRKLEIGADLSDEDRRILSEAVANVREHNAREDITAEGDRPEYVHVLLDGWACRNKTLRNGRRQIMAYLVPGDFCDLHSAILDQMDHTISTLSPARVAYISRRTVEELSRNRPAISRALWWESLVDEATLRQWLVNMGQLPADIQMMHLFCEVLLRLESVGLAEEDGFHFPLTQGELGETLGLSHVHVNCTVQQLRETGLIAWSGKRLTILDRERAMAFAQFEPNYLHLTKRRDPARAATG